MARIAISITKQTAFRDSVQQFSNVYNYTYIGLNPGADLAKQFLDTLVAIEKPLHASTVTFIRGRVWASGGTPAENEMIHQELLTGTGTRLPIASLDKERAVLIQWPAGKDKRGKPVTLKKWYHTCGEGGTVGYSPGILENVTGFSASQRDAWKTAVVGISPLTIGSQQYALCAESGRMTTGDPICHKYLEHHQLGDNWRG